MAPLDRVTRGNIGEAIATINNRGYVNKLSGQSRHRFVPLLRGDKYEDVFKIPDNFVVVYSIHHGPAISGGPSNKRQVESINAITAEVRDPNEPHDHDKRTIYFNGPPTVGTVVHELFHWLCHREFWTGFHIATGPSVGLLNEGITEYFTRRIVAEHRAAFYPAEFEEVSRLCGPPTDFPSEFLKRVEKAYFEGDVKAISSLKAAVYADRRRGGIVHR